MARPTHHLRQDHARAGKQQARPGQAGEAGRAGSRGRGRRGDRRGDPHPRPDDVLASLAKLHEAYDAEQIDFDTFEERRAELMSRLKID